MLKPGKGISSPGVDITKLEAELTIIVTGIRLLERNYDYWTAKSLNGISGLLMQDFHFAYDGKTLCRVQMSFFSDNDDAMSLQR